ncbi:MAG: hypothetical protein ACI39G_00505 [Pseudoramibacter sp.]
MWRIDPNLVLNLIGTVAPVVIALVASSKAAKAHQEQINNQLQLLLYRFDQLEKKVEKHNQIVERTYRAEQDISTAFKRYDELKARVERIEEWELHDHEGGKK